MELADIKDVSTFSEHVGGLFRIEIGPEQYAEATLVEAEALNSASRPQDLQSRQPFSLLFHLQGDVDLPQQTYPVSNDQFGCVPLFLVPVGPGQMESIFN